MAGNIFKMRWGNPVELHRVRDGVASLTLNPLDLPDKPGVYAICRLDTGKYRPLYVGSSVNIRKRLWGNSSKPSPSESGELGTRKIMKGIDEAARGRVFVLYATLVMARKPYSLPNQKTLVETCERELIELALRSNKNLINQRVTPESEPLTFEFQNAPPTNFLVPSVQRLAHRPLQ